MFCLKANKIAICFALKQKFTVGSGMRRRPARPPPHLTVRPTCRRIKVNRPPFGQHVAEELHAAEVPDLPRLTDVLLEEPLELLAIPSMMHL
jgi:hypothetical protein